MAADDLVMAMTGASGAPYGVRLLEVLLAAGRNVHLTLSPAAVQVIEQELDRRVRLDHFELHDLLGDRAPSPPSPLPRRGEGEGGGGVRYYHYMDFRAGIASGSFLTGGMVVCPCSMGTAAAIAHGLSQNLIHRAADVHLKERRPLVLMVRETPLHAGHLKSMHELALYGATILPPVPGFYILPKTVDELVDHSVGKALDQLGVAHDLFPRWSGPKKA